MKTKIVLYADDGKMLTNGTVYGKVIYLADGDNEADFYEISEDEYIELTKVNADEADGDA